MLSDTDILKVMETGELVVEPFSTAHVRPAAVTLHLGAEILVPQPVPLVDFRVEDTDIKYERHEITETQAFIIQPQQFVLGHTLEIITVQPSLGFLIEGRSTLARFGISVEQSATIVDPGHTRRPVTLEIYNCGPSPVTLYRGMSAAKALVFRLSTPAKRSFDTYSRYANQRNGVGKPLIKMKSVPGKPGR